MGKNSTILDRQRDTLTSEQKKTYDQLRNVDFVNFHKVFVTIRQLADRKGITLSEFLKRENERSK